MSIQSVTIGSDTIEVYAGLAALTTMANGRSSPGAVAFRALASDDQKRKLVEGTTYLEQQFWQGIATGLAGGSATTLSFPRTGLTDVNGNALDATNVPPQVNNAACEMALILCVDDDAAANVDAGNNVRALGAGSNRVEFFTPTSSRNGSATVLPEVVNRLVGRWLASASGAVAAAIAGAATGTSTCSDFACSTCSCTPCCCGSVRRDVNLPL